MLCRSSRLHAARCAGAKNCDYNFGTHLLSLRAQQSRQLPRGPEEGLWETRRQDTYKMRHQQENILEIWWVCWTIEHLGGWLRNLVSFSLYPLQTPGPGAYKLVDPCIYKQRAPQYSMTGRNMMPGETSQKPGPGAHHPEQVGCIRMTLTVSLSNILFDEQNGAK